MIAAIGGAGCDAERPRTSLAAAWNAVARDSVRASSLAAPFAARALAVVATCGYNAWTAYDPIANPTIGTGGSGAPLRRPPSERTLENRQVAFSYATLRCLGDLFPKQASMHEAQMVALGLDPADRSIDPASPVGVGNLAAAAELSFRHNDGSNQLGDLHPGPYSDYTGYAPVNTPETIVDPNAWQPLVFSNGHGGHVTPSYVGPQWGLVIPFALPRGDALRPGPPARTPDPAYVTQAEEIVALTAALDDRTKSIAQYWADGPNTYMPPGHWNEFAGLLSARDHHGFDDDVRFFFIVNNALLDASIAVWDTKRAYNSERPITAIHSLEKGRSIPTWNHQFVDGADWKPYQPDTFITPPFPEYVSGHSGFSAASAEVFALYTGSDAFNAEVVVPAGSSPVEPGVAPSQPVVLSWPTFSDAADQAGLSRRFGGIHFKDGDLQGRAMGRAVGRIVWQKAIGYITGSVP